MIEFGPLVVFFATYKMSDILFATQLMIITTVTGLIISYMIDRKISLPLLVSGSILIISGTITIISGDSRYIKMKPTIVYSIFGIALYIGYLRKNALIKDVFAALISLEESAWLALSRRFAIYFFVMAVINEIVWRNYSDDVWVNFKIFGFVPITILFILSQLPFVAKKRLK